MRKGRIVHGASLTWFLIFWQEIVVRAVLFRPPRSKSREARRKAEKPVEKSAGGLGPKLKPMRLSSTMPVSFKTKILCYMENAKEPFGPPVS
jgi:hypothetical protein